LPVYIVYFTAYARDGELHFADDVYGRDEGLMTRMATVAVRDSLRSGAAVGR